MSSYNNILIFIAFSVAVFGCDIVEEPYIREGGPPPPTSERKVLLEDYTGHSCVNCPGAAQIAYNLLEQYPGQVVLIAIHAGWFAQPRNEPYDNDFRTEVGEELNDFFGIITNPAGMVNRVGEGTNRILGEGQWPSAVGSELSKPAEAVISIKKEFNDQTRVLSASLEIEFLNSMTGTFRACAYIVEDSIVSPQMNNDPSIGPTPDILNYVHMHMLRGSLNGTWGDLVTNEEIGAGSNYTVALNDYVIDPSWKENHCGIIAFVYNNESYVIVQAEEEKIIGE